MFKCECGNQMATPFGECVQCYFKDLLKDYNPRPDLSLNGEMVFEPKGFLHNQKEENTQKEKIKVSSLIGKDDFAKASEKTKFKIGEPVLTITDKNTKRKITFSNSDDPEKFRYNGRVMEELYIDDFMEIKELLSKHKITVGYKTEKKLDEYIKQLSKPHEREISCKNIKKGNLVFTCDSYEVRTDDKNLYIYRDDELASRQVSDAPFKDFICTDNEEMPPSMDGLKESIKEMMDIRKEKQEDKMKTERPMNIYDVIRVLRDERPKYTLAEVLISNKRELVVLNKNDDLVIVQEDGLYDDEYLPLLYSEEIPNNSIFDLSYSQLDVLNATFEIIEEKKEEWINCTLIQMLQKFEQGHDIKINGFRHDADDYDNCTSALLNDNVSTNIRADGCDWYEFLKK